jgi:hypothetical protein
MSVRGILFSLTSEGRPGDGQVILGKKYQMADVALEGMLLIRSGRFVLQRHRLSAIDAVDGSSTGT